MTGPQVEGRPWWRGLRFFAVGWTILPLTLMLILAVGATAIALQATVKQLAENHSRTQVQLAADQVANELKRYLLTFQILAQEYRSADLKIEQTQDILVRYHYLLIDFVTDGGITVLDVDGTVVSTYPLRPDLVGQHHLQQPYYQAINPEATTPAFFDVTTEPGTRRQMVGLAVPLLNGQGEFAGLLVGQFYLDVQQFERFLRPWQEMTLGSAYLVDQQGKVIFHPDAAQISRDVSQQAPVLSLHQTGQVGAYTHSTDDMSREIVAYAPITGTGWGLIISTPWFQVVQPVQRALWFIAISLLLGLFGLILVVF